MCVSHGAVIESVSDTIYCPHCPPPPPTPSLFTKHFLSGLRGQRSLCKTGLESGLEVGLDLLYMRRPVGAF